MSSRERLDVALASRGLAESRERARRLILAGLVRVNGAKISQAGHRLREDDEITVDGPDHPYVSRGGGQVGVGA